MPSTAVTLGRVARPLPGPELFPPSNYPPAQTNTLTGTQTVVYRPNALSDRTFDLTGAVWNNSPNTLLYPIVINDAGSGVPNGRNTRLVGPRINGTQDPLADRDTQYNSFHSGIEHSCDSATGWIEGDTIYVARMQDGYRTRKYGRHYLKRFYGVDILDDFIEFEEAADQPGNPSYVYIYDSLVEGCPSGLSDKDGALPRTDGTIEIDGLLLWLKPTVALPSFQGGTRWSGIDGQAELDTPWSDGRYRASFGIWKGNSASRNNVIVRNSWFRVDRLPTYGNEMMMWPGGGLSVWGTAALSAVYRNVKLLWTGSNRNWEPTSDPYPGPALPSGVELVTGQTALDMWNRAAASWKAAHGY